MEKRTRRDRGRPRRTRWASFVIQHPQMVHGQRLDLQRADPDPVDDRPADHQAADRDRSDGGGPDGERPDGERATGARADGFGWFDDGTTHGDPPSIADANDPMRRGSP